LVPLFLVLKRNQSKNREGGGISTLGGCRSDWENTTTNQKLAFAVGRRLGRARDRGGMCGGSFRYCLGRRKEDKEINNEKYIVAFGGL
jgi:hypothetical protein